MIGQAYQPEGGLYNPEDFVVEFSRENHLGTYLSEDEKLSDGDIIFADIHEKIDT